METISEKNKKLIIEQLIDMFENDRWTWAGICSSISDACDELRYHDPKHQEALFLDWLREYIPPKLSVEQCEEWREQNPNSYFIRAEYYCWPPYELEPRLEFLKELYKTL